MGAKYDHYLILFWTEELEFFVNCSDCEAIKTQDDINLLKYYIKEYKEDGPALYCCKKRQMRPQKPYYKYIKPKNHALFDECGPERSE